MKIHKSSIRLQPSPKRMLLRPFVPGSSTQVAHIFSRILSIKNKEGEKILNKMYKRFKADSKEDMRSVFLKHFHNVENFLSADASPDENHKQLIGAYFTQQYALESTALFNPSIVPHPVQNKKGVLRFILSLRAIGEGHISSIVFMEGEIDAKLNITLKENSPFIQEPTYIQHRYEKALFMKSVEELGILTDLSGKVFEQLKDWFDYGDLDRAIAEVRNRNKNNRRKRMENMLHSIRQFALSNFSISFSTHEISAKAIYPSAPSQVNGLEDARFVKFVEDDGSFKYYATFTAFDGRVIMPEMLETTNFNEFKISTLNGPAARNKGMALFPRKINGCYMMLGRQDNESLYIMRSDNPYFWYESTKLMSPEYPWEWIQIGNCGSPMEIKEGWLVITHGVGPVRSYSLGAILLDKDDPRKVIGRLKEPLLKPDKQERYGYVPNVLYTCGAMVVDRTLILPYAMSDVVTSFATIKIDEILKKMS